ncbi:hypothetical protein TRV_06605 [Trichophyton verrucosum HKI 0517]|uniref:Uncharacterized protein n=1 Tax=Trichophyton verrucosum (strain HKI 0517) TaxID=663202 RepID=D4DHE9_TRIVH|nr:uncharacterized protein TRV_06605 [Trichophyton verrucosum HKI 0517]EFE38731.1 hypothetical protein TRV_06605 [Trichophyton verrucosum HKI 0517]
MQVCGRVDGVSAVPLVLADDLEEGDGDEAAGVGEERVAGLVPVLVVLSADDVEEVSLAEGELLSVLGRRLVVVQRFYHLSRGQDEQEKKKKRGYLTFLGGKMARADLGVIETCWWCCDFSLSPLSERRMALSEAVSRGHSDWETARERDGLPSWRWLRLSMGCDFVLLRLSESYRKKKKKKKKKRTRKWRRKKKKTKTGGKRTPLAS